MMLTVFLLSLIFGVAVGNIGKCPDPKPIEDFDLEKMMDTKVWYQVNGFETLDNAFNRCIRYAAKMAEGSSKKAIGFEKYTRFGQEYKNFYTLTTPNHSEPGKLEMTFENESPANLSVLYADYDKYIVSYSCHQALIQYNHNIWVLAKENTLDDHERLGIYDKIKSLGIKEKLMEIDHKDCPED